MEEKSQSLGGKIEKMIGNQWPPAYEVLQAAKDTLAGKPSIMRQVENISSVRRIFDELKYACPTPYRLRSARTTLESGEGHCMELALASALLMEKLGHEPLILDMDAKYSEVEQYGHAVYVYQEKKGFNSFSKSRYPELGHGNCVFPSIEDLAESYREGFAKRGLRLFRIAVTNLNDTSLPWRYSKREITDAYWGYLKSLDYVEFFGQKPT